MPTVFTQTPEMPLPQVPLRKRWTREQCLALGGLFQQERLELVDGELISKMGKNRPHTRALMKLVYLLAQAFGNQFVESETSIDLSPEDNPTSEPEPDVIVLNKDADTVSSANPRPQDLHLVVEISDSTLKFDLTVKAALYARAEIAEYWVIDIEGRQLFCHREPALGRYASVVVYQEHETLAPLGAPGALLSPADVLLRP